MPQISIIVPVYKVEPYIHRCVDSILIQTFTDFELILVDDGSPDHCGVICDEYAKNDSRIHVIHQQNGGLSAARNSGIDWVFQNSNSEYFSYIDSDDWVHPRYLELLYTGICKYNANISQCLFLETDGNVASETVGEEMVSMSPDEEYLNFYNPHAWGKLYRRKCFDELRYPNGKLFEDVAIWYKLLFCEEEIVIIKSQLYYYLNREGSIVNSNWTAAHLDQVYAWEEQMKFLDIYGNKSVYEAALNRFIWVLINQMKQIKSSDSIGKDEKNKHSELLRKKLSRLLRKNRSLVKDSQNYHWYYEIAHPRLAWFYWTTRGIIGKKR